MSNKKAFLTIFIITAGLFGCYFILKKPIFLIIALVIGLSGTVSRAARMIIVSSWFKIGNILGYVNSRIILSGIFFLVLTPIALLSRLFSKDKLQLKRKKGDASYFIDRGHTFQAEDFEKPW